MDKYFTSSYVAATDKKSVAVEDSIMVKDSLATGGSKILSAFKAPFTATAINRILGNGYAVIGSIKMPEFGIAEVLAKSENNVAIEVVKSGVAEYVLANDFAGRLKKDSIKSGLYFLHPTYGSVSRFGLIPSFSSADQIGILSSNAEGIFELLESLAGVDENDSTMHDNASYKRVKIEGKLKVALLNNIDAPKARSEAKFLDTMGAKALNIDTLPYLASIFSTLFSAEFCNNTNRYDGVKYGFRAKEYKNFNDIYLNTRTQGFGLDAKLQVIMGNVCLSQENYAPLYNKSMQVRRLLKEELDRVFDEFDVLVVPHDYRKENTFAEVGEYGIAPLAGLPSLTIGNGKYGYEIITKELCENKLLSFMKEVK